MTEPVASEPAEPTTRQELHDALDAALLAENTKCYHDYAYGSGEAAEQAKAEAHRLIDLLADPAQTTKLEEADLSGGEADAAADPTLPVDPGERALAWCRQWMATRETVHKRTAERDLLRWLHAEKAHQHAALLAQRDQWWDHVGRERAQLEAERDERQARIDKALEWWRQERDADSHWPLSLEDSAKVNSLRYRVYAALTGQPLAEQPLPAESTDRPVRAALAGGQPTSEDTP